MVIIIASCKINNNLFPVAINHLKKCSGNLFPPTPLSSWHCLYFVPSFYLPVLILKQSIVFLCTVQSNHSSLLQLWNKSSPKLKFNLPTKLEEEKELQQNCLLPYSGNIPAAGAFKMNIICCPRAPNIWYNSQSWHRWKNSINLRD